MKLQKDDKWLDSALSRVISSDKPQFDAERWKEQYLKQELSREKTAKITPNVWSILIKSRITKLAAVVVVVLAVCWLAVSDRGEPEQQQTNARAVAVTPETPAELMSVISLSMVFRDGDMEAMEEQFDKAEKLVGPGLKERITIDQLICELEECKQI